ncbi:MAG: hypothetical protein HY267_07515 [Deltaproteobacteria bacterium]|nr:hypothetical protein [Deltaproteobacteria bacterium]
MFRLKLFGNNQPAALNLRHRWYHSKARQFWTKSETPSSSADVLKWATELRREGYVQLEPGVSPELLDSLHDQANRAFADPASYISPTAGTLRLKDGIGNMPDIARLFTNDIVQTVENYYGSFFKVYWVQVYRTLPTDMDPDTSFLWHVDNCPPQIVKLMVYLTDTQENTGAFRLKPRPLSTRLLDQGFFDRSKNDRFAHVLNDASTTKIFEGPKGTSILFLNWGCVHRAKHPEIKHRDVAVFFLIPSLTPWDRHLKENVEKLSLREDVCPNPALF